MKTDAKLQHDVIDELEWEPSIDASQIGVTAKDGVVTLTGYVPRYAQKLEAEHVAKSIAGVKALANDIEVRLPGSGERNDTEIAAAAVSALRWHSTVPKDKVKVTVCKGWITLEGEVEWQFQRQAARDAVCYLTGVKGVTNNITLVPAPKATDIKSRIETAFKRKAEVDASHVRVNAANGKVTLKGDVASWSEYAEAERVAWAAPGVTTVKNDLIVGVGTS